MVRREPGMGGIGLRGRKGKGRRGVAGRGEREEEKGPFVPVVIRAGPPGSETAAPHQWF